MTKLFVGNLPYGASEVELEIFFAQAGFTVDGVNVMRDRFSGVACGFGFVQIHDDAEAARALECCKGREFLGRLIEVEEVRPIPARPAIRMFH